MFRPILNFILDKNYTFMVIFSYSIHLDSKSLKSQHLSLTFSGKKPLSNCFQNSLTLENNVFL